MTNTICVAREFINEIKWKSCPINRSQLIQGASERRFTISVYWTGDEISECNQIILSKHTSITGSWIYPLIRNKNEHLSFTIYEIRHRKKKTYFIIFIIFRLISKGNLQGSDSHSGSWVYKGSALPPSNGFLYFAIAYFACLLEYRARVGCHYAFLNKSNFIPRRYYDVVVQ